MDATPTLSKFLQAALFAGVAALVALSAFLATAAHAQQIAPEQEVEALTILGVTHSADGRMTVSAAAAPQGSTVDRFSAFIDNVKTTIVAVETPGRAPAAVVIAIDTSGSMTGQPIESAREAAKRLVARLEAEDPVAIVSFSAQPLVLSGFTTNRSTTQAVLDSVAAEGDTALYDAVSISAGLLRDHETIGAKILVLLTDGQDTASVNAAQRAISISTVAASGGVVHAFALGQEADEEYLSELAVATEGTISQVASDDSLGALFESLGSRLAATFEFELTAQPLSRGAHNLELLAFVDGTLVRRGSSFEVENAGLLTATVDAAGDPTLIVVDIIAAVPTQLLRIDASIDGTPITYSDGRAFVDAWALMPGSYTLTIEAFIADELAQRFEVTVEVPALEPQFEVVIDSSGLTPQLLISGRAQGPGPHTLRILADGEELLTTEDRDARVAYSAEREVTVQFIGQGGRVLGQELIERQVVAIPAAGGGLDLTYAFLAVALLAAAAAGLYLLRKRRVKSPPKQRILRRFTAPRELPGRPEQSGPLGALHMLGPDGSTQKITLGLRPITIGSSPKCDLVLEGDDIEPLHARVSARGNGEFQIHGFGSQSANLFGRHENEEWIMLRSGESIALGEYQITIIDADQAHAESA